MNYLEEKIVKEGKVIGDEILKVDSFLNQQVDPELMDKIGNDFANHFRDKNITKVVTIETSGIAPALMAAKALNVPMLILKKQQAITINEDVCTTEVFSFTKQKTYNLFVSKKNIKDEDNILIIDDFLANGEAAGGAIRLIKNTKANIAGIGIVIEKSFQEGRTKIENQGYEVYSIARIKSLKKQNVEFISRQD